MLIYKILLPAEWDAFEAAGRFDGSALDRDSGFIHLSSRDQVAETARLMFADEPALVLIAIDDSLLAEPLRWEPTPDRGRFPHLYGTLPRAAVVATYAVASAENIDTALPPHTPSRGAAQQYRSGKPDAGHHDSESTGDEAEPHAEA